MFRTRLFTGPLLEAVAEGGAAPAAAPVAAPAPAPVATAPAASEPGDIAPNKPSEGILARIAAKRGNAPGAAPAAGAQQAPAAAPAVAPAEAQAQQPANDTKIEGDTNKQPPKRLPKVDKPRPTSVAERLKMKAVEQAARAEEHGRQTELAKQLESTRAELDLTRSAELKFRQAMDGGDYDAALKAIGVAGGVEGFTKSYLERKAAIPKTDPKTLELEQRLAEYERRENERETARQEQEAQARFTAQQQRDLQDLAEEAKASGIEELAGAVKVEGFLPLAYNLMHRHSQEIKDGALTMDDIWAKTHDSYQQLFDQMTVAGFVSSGRGSNHEAPEGANPAGRRDQSAPDRSAVLSAQPARQPASHISPANASEPVAQRVAVGAEFDGDFGRRKSAARQRFMR
jgi:hypothetical protein